MQDPVPDIREIITDRKEAGGLPSSTFLNLAPEKQEKLLSAAVVAIFLAIPTWKARYFSMGSKGGKA